MFLRCDVCELNSKANIVFNTEVAGSDTFAVIKRENINVRLLAQTSGWKQFVCQVLRSGIEKNKVLLLFFSLFLPQFAVQEYQKPNCEFEQCIFHSSAVWRE